MGIHYQKGTYNVECIEAAVNEYDNGNASITLKVKVLDSVGADGLFVPESEQYERRIMITVDPSREGQVEDVMQRLRHAGWTGSRFETFCQDMVGIQFAADCWHGVNKGKDPKYAGLPEEKWALWSANRPQSKPLENNPAAAKSLNAMFGRHMKSATISAPQKTAPKPLPQSSVVSSHAYSGRGNDSGPPDGDDLF